jgi:aminoglycoside phosphotransferase (APT) family kinase protein
VSVGIPARFASEVVRRIGHGGEATVYELTGGRALRVYHGKPHGADQIAAFYRQISSGSPSFALPQILEQGVVEGVAYSVDRLIPGRALHDCMSRLDGPHRAGALTSYADAVEEIAALPCPDGPYGEFLRDDDSVQSDTWRGYLLARMARCLQESSGWLPRDVQRLDRITVEITARINALPPPRWALVHGDYFPGNVLVSDEGSVTGVIDFGPLTVVGDPTLDLASAVIFLEVVRGGYRPADTAFVRGRLLERHGAALADLIETYRAWYAIRFSPYRDDDANLYDWCVTSLRRFADDVLTPER